MSAKNKRDYPASVTVTSDGGRIVPTNCFECHSKCGVLAHVKDGKLIKIEGNPEEPRSKGMICSKGFAATQMLYSPDRLNYPLRRTNPKKGVG